MCKVCDLEEESVRLQEELNFRVSCFQGELRFNKGRAVVIRAAATKLFEDLLDKLEEIESTRQQFDMMDEVAADSDLKH